MAAVIAGGMISVGIRRVLRREGGTVRVCYRLNMPVKRPQRSVPEGTEYQPNQQQPSEHTGSLHKIA